MGILEYIAHIRGSDKVEQSVDNHLSNVQKIAENYGKKINVQNLAGIAGLLHDFGKYSDTFKNYIKEAVYNPDSPPPKGSVDHSTAGGKYIHSLLHTDSSDELEKILGEILGNIIISHHMGLQDFITPKLTSDYLKRVEEKSLPEYSISKEQFLNFIDKDDFRNSINKSKQEISQVLQKAHKNTDKPKINITLSFLMKYVFSCLIDADRTDSRLFEEGKTLKTTRSNREIFETYSKRLNTHINALKGNKGFKNKINKLRSEMSEECDEFGENPSGIYTLSIPTGGGKTLSSLRYALKHATKFNKDRIVYIVPYTTIIEQNAEEVRQILNDDENILEHHSNVNARDYDNDEEDTVNYLKEKSLKLAKDNWDIPIVFTTMVQYLNTFYSGGTRDVRRLHNLANSIIIFDEVQSIPAKCVSLFNESVNFLKNVGNSSIILCTATQPALDLVNRNIDAIDGEIINNLDEVTSAFKRVNIKDETSPSGWDTAEVSKFSSAKIESVSSLLVILNTKTVVRKLYEHLKEIHSDKLVYHLSTSMCAEHRKNILNEVKSVLDQGEKVICVSTQLIEAGVDISFDCVIRSLSGLDSIAQAAGRCNRHGEHGIRDVYIINHAEENLDYLKTIKSGAEITRKMLIDRKGNSKDEILSRHILTLYFERFYHELGEELDYYVPAINTKLYDLLDMNQKYKNAYRHKKDENFPLVLGMSAKTAGRYFNVIDSSATPVIVPYKEGKDIIAELNGELSIENMSKLLKKAQQFTVNIYEREKNMLSKNGNLIILQDGNFLAVTETAYDKNYGIDIKGEGDMDFQLI